MGNGDGRAVLKGYLDAVEDIAPMFISEAARRLLTGETERFNAAFAPTPTELANEARRIFMADNERKRDLLPPPAPEPVDEAMRSRIRKRMDDLVAELRPPVERRKVFDTTPSEALEKLHHLRRTAKQRTVDVSPELRAMLGK